MELLKNIEITNFRGFDKLQIDGFSKINLFVGKNNSGKTSVLEAIFLLLGLANPRLPMNVNKMRGFKLEAENLKYLFNNLDYKHPPLLSGGFSNEMQYSLRFIPYLTQYINSEDVSSDWSTSVTKEELDSLELTYSIKKEDKEDSGKRIISIRNNSVGGELQGNHFENLYSVFLSSDNNDENTLTRYSEIVKKKGGDTILKALQAFDKRIVAIQPLPDGLFFNVEGINELVPSNLLGEGMRRFLNIITTVSEKSKSYILIDEIENGLHYSAYRLLWKSLISMINTMDIQLFITTHNIEVLSCLKSVLEESEYTSMQEYAKVFTIANTAKAGYKAYKYSYNAFKDAIDQEIELRS